MPGVDILAQLGAADWATTDAASLQRALQRARFDVMGVASRRALGGDLVGGNAETRDLLAAAPQMRGWVVINPLYPERSSDEMRKYASRASWFGAFLNGGEGLASGSTREMMTALRRYTKPVLVHVPDEQATRELEVLATEFSNVKIIALGAGGEAWQACTLAAKRVTNIFLEPFSGGAHRGKLEAIFASLGPNRVLFASNHPVHNPGGALGLLTDAKLTDSERQSVLSTNATRLFGLNRAPAEE